MILELLDDAVCNGARLAPACRVIGLSPRTVQRWRDYEAPDRRAGPLSPPKQKLGDEERKVVIAVANSPEFRDKSPRQIVPLLADRGVYIASESTFYRVLHENGLMTHRMPSRPAQSRKPKSHVASAPNQVWCWDITYLRSDVRGAYYYLYLILDLYSRKIVAAHVASVESMEVASELVLQATQVEDVDTAKLVLHADNGGPMKGSTMLATLHKLGILASFSRPRVSDDNPHAEALFRTMKYRPGYPRKPFASLEAARAWVAGFVAWYNHQHLHSAIRYVTPQQRHERRDVSLLRARHEVYQQARKRTPLRWTRATRNWSPIGAVVLNPENHPQIH